jgi:RNA polymerase sigma factor (sigma-70 family)
MRRDNEALVRACRQGDAGAWEELITRYQWLIYAIARRSGLDRDQATDVLQRVLAILLEQLDRIEQPAQIGAWLTTTAQREAWRLARREQISSTLIPYDNVKDEADEVPDNTLLPDQMLLRLEEQHLVQTAMANLDARCRTLLTMLFYEPEPPSYAHIAATLGVREGSIGPTRARCLQKLLQLLNNAGF